MSITRDRCHHGAKILECKDCRIAELEAEVERLEEQERHRVSRLGQVPETVREACARAEAQRDRLAEAIRGVDPEMWSDGHPREEVLSSSEEWEPVAAALAALAELEGTDE